MPISPTSGPLLYVIDVALRLHRMECGQQRMDPVAYRLFARRLRQALAACPMDELPLQDVQPAALREAIEDRHFLEHGHFQGQAGLADVALLTIARCRA
ncbi:MAG: hypothetical protein HY856_06890 [Burkholderiales bacterium]|jgi:hypothetical protein|nr:hypothetical protein [Burkholderiales bacterium]